MPIRKNPLKKRKRAVPVKRQIELTLQQIEFLKKVERREKQLPKEEAKRAKNLQNKLEQLKQLEQMKNKEKTMKLNTIENKIKSISQQIEFLKEIEKREKQLPKEEAKRFTILKTELNQLKEIKKKNNLIKSRIPTMLSLTNKIKNTIGFSRTGKKMNFIIDNIKREKSVAGKVHFLNEFIELSKHELKHLKTSGWTANNIGTYMTARERIETLEKNLKI